jgi:predicted nucleotide-binding protein
MTQPAPPKVFLSYTHDSPEHDDMVIDLADRLRDDGIDAQIDQYELHPAEGWTRWMRNRIKDADFVIAICTEVYQRRAEGHEQPGKGRGGNREGLAIDQEIYESDGRNKKFIAVILRETDRRFIPDFLRTYQNESIETEMGYETLYRRLTNQPDVVKPELGRLRSLPPREHKNASRKSDKSQQAVVLVDSLPKDPSIFIGSSRNGLEAAKALRARLKSVADVTLWSEHPEFTAVSGNSLDALLRQPERFDFAVMVFGPEDHVSNNEGVFEVPRENVLFELGLFMAHLGRGRAFAVVAKGVRLLSDLGGLIWVGYEPPNDVSEAVGKICARIKETSRRNALAYDGPTDVFQFRDALLEEAKRLWHNNGKHVTVCNLALDMEATWPHLGEILHSPEVQELTWHSAMLDPEWKGFREFQSPSVSVEKAKMYIKDIQQFWRANGERMAERRITFECRTYRSVPVLHGFLLNNSFLILTLLKRDKDGKVISLGNAYQRIPRKNEVTAHTIDAYTDWFDYAWKHSERSIWPEK